ncbi:glycosyltransferase [Nocardioides pinisoli]|uniref:Glycosyltransferase n=1 Tax=Nocardioides pinisoli TaxID=2950279 RepID=A0ABT1KSD3_9ACTN|nr:glycosyltransferase [Nocardioides pinisoli]MCP3420655.1 glycosyltransferase [Nocardioides pinisoli]
MRVLLVAHQYWPVPGSASQVLGGLVARLRERGHEVVVLTSRPDARTGRELERLGPQGERVLFVGPPEAGVSAPRRVTNLASFAAGVRRAARTLQYDVVVSDPPPTAATAALAAASSRKVPFVYYLADSWGGAARGSRRPWIRAVSPVISAVEDRALTRARLVIAATDGMREVAERAGAHEIHVVRNGVPTDVFSPEGDEWWPHDDRRPFFLYAGNAGVVHGAEVFCAAAERLWREGADFDVVYMGYGSDSPLIDAAAERWPERLVQVGLRPPLEVAAASRTAIGALTSLRDVPQYADARPIKAMSGLACGTPLVYAGRGEFADEVRAHGLGFVSSWDVDEVVGTLRAALDAAKRSEKVAEMRARCAAYALENFDDRISSSRAADIVERAAVEQRG